MNKPLACIPVAAILGLAACAAQPGPGAHPPVPAMIVEVVPKPPVSPAPLIWQPGHWDWTGNGYVWRPGEYVSRQGHGDLWMPGYWGATPSGGTAWQPAHWL